MTATAEVQDLPESPRFAWDDPFLLNDQLSEDERMIRDTARDYAQGKLAPRILEAYRNETVDRSVFSEMGELGWPFFLDRHAELGPVGIRYRRAAACEMRNEWEGQERGEKSHVHSFGGQLQNPGDT